MKIKSLGGALFLAVALLLFTGCCKPEVTGSVANTLRPQETNNWCWAATTQMLAAHFSVAVTQCSLANQRFGMTSCCSPENEGASCPKNGDCNKPGWLMLTECGLSYEESNAGLSWESLRKQIFCSKKPMGYAYGTPGVVGHVVVMKGYLTLNGTNYVVLNDPWAPCTGQERIITYDQYADPAGSSTHWRTWYNIKKP
jgi:hypothetical protein